MARAWLSVLIGKNKLRLYSELGINDIPFGVCFMGVLALEDYYDILKEVSFKLGEDKERSIIRPLIIQYAKSLNKQEFSRALNFTLGQGRYAEFWFKDEWDNIAWDSWLTVGPTENPYFLTSFTGLYHKDGEFTINYNGKVIDVFSEEFISRLPEHRHLDALYYYLFKNPIKDSEISDDEFFAQMGISIQKQIEPDWTYYKC